ncbi:unnamed protein product [Musa acuminata subsp. malaccensis]|uniref:(wild Malaysian banana) hypothetical protein n=1 Tax=Musa acuminata subsp. malaccensis TaxID=214687 RepID=A0A8D7F971_MUSAM|nr:unnamed protein product [Musa acuminata subsp. malaccensis]
MGAVWCFEGEGNNRGRGCLRPRFDMERFSLGPKRFDHLPTKQEYLVLCLLVLARYRPSVCG